MAHSYLIVFAGLAIIFGGVLSAGISERQEVLSTDVERRIDIAKQSSEQYYIHSFLNLKALDLSVGRRIPTMWRFHGGWNQKWHWKGDELCCHPYKYILNVDGNTHWKLTPEYYLEAQDGTNRVLDIERENKRNGARLVLSAKHGGKDGPRKDACEKWLFMPVKRRFG